MDFSEDIADYNKQLHQNDELYGEIHSVFKRVTGGGGGVLGMSSTTSLAELGRTLATIRSTSLDAVNKRFTAKKTLVELRLKEIQAKNGELDGDTVELGRSILKEVVSTRQQFAVIQHTQKTSEAKNLLDQRIQHELETGNIKTTANEKAMKYDFQKVVQLSYDQTKKEIVATNKKTGEIISDYPKDRIPKMKVLRVENEQAITNTGINLPLYKAETK